MGWYSFEFLTNDTTVLSDATHYCIVIRNNFSSGTSARIAYSNDTSLSGTAFRSNDKGGNWDATYLSTFNFAFKVNGDGPEPQIATIVSPANGVSNQPSDITLSWNNSTFTDTVDVYLDTSSPPTSKVVDDTDVETFNSGGLNVSDTYYWRVDTKNAYGTTTGTVWTFDTGAQIAISNKAELQAINDNLSASYFLTDDIDISGAWTPLGGVAEFTGVLDGRDFTISNLTIDTTSLFKGLFSFLNLGPLIFDLNIDSFSITNGGYGGCLAGASGPATITNVHITNSSVDSKSTSDSRQGGLIGSIIGACQIFNCSADVAVTGTDFSDKIGGFVGEIAGSGFSISKCFATGNVIGVYTQADSGGFVGRISNTGSITDCYATGDVTNNLATVGSTGGFVGDQNSLGTINTSYSVGRVTASGSNAGGFCGDNDGTINDCFYDADTSLQSDAGKGQGASTAQMQKISLYPTWDFSGIAGVWKLSEDFSYPLFVLMPSPATLTAPGNGSSNGTLTPLLQWEAGSPYIPELYDIYLGRTSGSLELLVGNRQSTSVQILSVLRRNTTYYWRVDSADQNAVISGTEWSFTTLGFDPPLPTGMSLEYGEDDAGEEEILAVGTPTGINGMVTIKRLVAAANDKIWYET